MATYSPTVGRRGRVRMNRATVIVFIVELVVAAVAGVSLGMWLTDPVPTGGQATEVSLTNPSAVPDPPAHTHVLALAVVPHAIRYKNALASLAGPEAVYDYEPTSTSPSEDVRTSAANAAAAVYAMTGVNTLGADPLVQAGTSGPSAGLAYALTLLEAAGHGQLIPDGALVAATGTITADGTVGPVGGYEYKFPAAEQAGATLLLGPTETPADMQSRYAATFHPVANLAEAARLLCDTYHSSDDICRHGADTTRAGTPAVD